MDFLCHATSTCSTAGPQSIARIVELVADGTPLLFHCAAGKDRTGVVAAVLLGLAGVPHEEIAADYHATAGAMAAFVDWLTVTYPEAMDAMTSQPPEYLEAPIEAMAAFLDAGRRAPRLDGGLRRRPRGRPRDDRRLRSALVE